MQQRRSPSAYKFLFACCICLLLANPVARGELVIRGETPTKPQPLPTPEPPAKVVAFNELAKNCAAYDRLVNKSGWGPVWSETFDSKTSSQWLPSADALAVPPVPEGANRPSWPKISAAVVDHREVAVMDASNIQAGYWPIGPKVRGEFAIEYVAMAQSANPCDMSIVLDGLQRGPGFQFGGYMNQRNLLWFPVPEQGPGKSVGIDLPNTALIQAGSWQKVRLECRGGLLTASVDGVVVGTRKVAPLGPHQYQPLLYVYNSQIAIDEIKIETKIPLAQAVNSEKAFTQVFGNQSHKDVEEQIDQLVELLDDPNYKVREAAGKLLGGMGALALPALKDAMENGSPEAVARAKPLYDAIAPIAVPTPATQPVGASRR